MNDARRRRLVIQKRATLSKIKQVMVLRESKCEHGEGFSGLCCSKCHPVKRTEKRAYRAYVYLKEIILDSDIPHHIPVDIPADSVNKTIREMYTCGFWTSYYDTGVVFIPPHEIRRVVMWHEDSQENGNLVDKQALESIDAAYENLLEKNHGI